MADSLDDFFAKKDKKRKNKSQSAALSNEALVRELEEGSKQSANMARRENKTTAAMELLGLGANDNDWKDFEEVEKRDYTGLKVKEMSIQDQDDEQRRVTEQVEQAPEAIPWKSKQETVAAIISSSQPASDLVEHKEDKDETTPTPATSTTTAPAATTTETSTPATTATTADTATTATTADTAITSTAETPPAASVKKVYKPPHERLEKEYKVLEPTRLTKGMRSSSSRFGGGAKINIEDFPSLS